MEQSSHHSPISGFSNTTSVDISPNIGRNAWGMPSGFSSYHLYHGPSDASHFSSSLPVLRHEKLNFTSLGNELWSTDDSKLDKFAKDVDCEESIGALDLSGIGIILPDNEDLLAGIADNFDSGRLSNLVEDVEDCDIFGSGGGMELDSEPLESLVAGVAKTSSSDGSSGNGSAQHSISNGGVVSTEHPYGEHPSRTLFVRNINSNVEDSELRSLFEQYGDIRTLYTACKHRGFVMISYYDIRAARTAMRSLQNKPVRRRKLDIHFSIPKENPPEKDVNQGTLVVFNLDPSVTNDDIRRIFGAYGEVKEIRETPHKRHHKFIEFYDVRAAEAALRSLNRRDIAGKRIKLEPSRPGGARRSYINQLNQDFEHDEMKIFRHSMGSPATNSPPGCWMQFSSPSDCSSLNALNLSPTSGSGIPMVNNHLSGLASVIPPLMSNSTKIAPIGKDQKRTNYVDQVVSSVNSNHGVTFQHSHSLPEHNEIMLNNNLNPVKLSPFSPQACSASGFGTLTGAQFLWGSPESQTSTWATPSLGHSFTFNGQGQRFPYSSRQGAFFSSSQHHVRSAPSDGESFGYFPKSPEASSINQVSFGSRLGISQNITGNPLLNTSSLRRHISPGILLSGNMPENGSPGFKVTHGVEPMLLGSAPFPVSVSNSFDGFIDCSKSHRVDSSGIQLGSNTQYRLDLEKLTRGEDTRTTLMLKNIPNKYTSSMLLAAIDENHKGTYDFLYLPIDFKNKCNVGYAFINMVSPSHIVPFYQEFNGKKWEKFNSEKVASLAYARIQGKMALVSHFQNSSLMNEDKRCRPIVFHSDGQEAFDQGTFSSNGLNMYVHQQNESLAGDSSEDPSRNDPGKKPYKYVIPGRGFGE